MDGGVSGHINGPDAEGAERALSLAVHALLTALHAVKATAPGAASDEALQALVEDHAILWGEDLPQPLGDD